LAGLAPVDSARRFSLVAGGPFHSVLRLCGLVAADELPTWRTGGVLAVFAWLPLAMLTVVQSLFDDGYFGLGFFSDPTVYSRYLVAIWAMIATERYADERIELLTRQFRDARLLPDESRSGFEAAIATADRRSSSRLAEGIVFLMAIAQSSLVARYIVAASGSSWEGKVIADEVVLSWAGQTAGLVSNPLFIFLALRWVWRFAVWTMLLFRVSRLPLQLTPMHPDRSAGLGFLSIYPSIFTGFVFALSCVIATSFLKELGIEEHDTQTVWIAISVWLAMVLFMFLGPLLVFVHPLYLARERALLEYGRLANQFHLSFHHTWIAEGRSGEELMGSSDPSSASDLNASVQAVQEMRFAPIDRSAVFQLVTAAGVPMLAVVAKQISLAEVVKLIIGSIL
jgi:hypothetical protein